MTYSTASCHRCGDTGLIWLNSEGVVVQADDLTADTGFKCTHDHRMDKITEYPTIERKTMTAHGGLNA